MIVDAIALPAVATRNAAAIHKPRMILAFLHLIDFLGKLTEHRNLT
jgi:hypothetical protein